MITDTKALSRRNGKKEMEDYWSDGNRLSSALESAVVPEVQPGRGTQPQAPGSGRR